MRYNLILALPTKCAALSLESPAPGAGARFRPEEVHELFEVGPLVPDFRALAHSVTVHPKVAREGFQVEVKGKLAASAARRSPDKI